MWAACTGPVAEGSAVTSLLFFHVLIEVKHFVLIVSLSSQTCVFHEDLSQELISYKKINDQLIRRDRQYTHQQQVVSDYLLLFLGRKSLDFHKTISEIVPYEFIVLNFARVVKVYFRLKLSYKTNLLCGLS